MADPPMLKKLCGKKIFSVTQEGEGFLFNEECDHWFAVTLTAEEVKTLGMELVEMAESVLRVRA